jgi:uncharacterized protein (DUF58 family)
MVDRPTLTPEGVLSRLEWRIIRRLDGRLQGDYRTLFRGAGVDVVDLREYQPGDDLRHIDWNVTARTDTPHVRQYLEDRDVTAWLLLDRSPSMGFGPVDRSKHVVLTEIAATVAQLLSRGGNRVGAVLFDAQVDEIVPPGSGRKQVLRIISRLLDTPSSGPEAAPAPREQSVRSLRSPWSPRIWRSSRSSRSSRAAGAGAGRRMTALAVPLRAAQGIARRRSMVVIVSDFITEPGWERPLTQLAARHDVVALRVVDRREFDLPNVGMIYVEDAETGEQIFVDSDDPEFQRRLRAAADERQAALVAAVRTAGVELFTVTTDEDLVRALARIAELRRRRVA